MARIAIIEKQTGKVVNVSEGDELPQKIEREAPAAPVKGDDESAEDFALREADYLEQVTEFETNENRNAWLDAHELVFSETAQIGYSWDGNNFEAPQVEPPQLTIQEQIVRLEQSVTPRRIREAILGPGEEWLQAVDDQIAALRAQL